MEMDGNCPYRAVGDGRRPAALRFYLAGRSVAPEELNPAARPTNRTPIMKHLGRLHHDIQQAERQQQKITDRRGRAGKKQQKKKYITTDLPDQWR